MANKKDDLIAPPPDGLAFLQKTYVAGVHYHDFAGGDLPLDPGAPVELRREPDIPYDEPATEIYTLDDVKLGYIPAKRNKYLARLLDAGLQLPARLERVDSPERLADPPRHARPKLDVAVFVTREE